jgi:hypothetical protein
LIGRHSITHEGVFIKISEITVSALFKISLLEDLIRGPRIPFYRWRGNIEGKIALATDPYGPSLEEVFQLLGRLFNAQMVALVAE